MEADTTSKNLRIVFVGKRFQNLFSKPLACIPFQNACCGGQYQVHVESAHGSTLPQFCTVSDQHKTLSLRSNKIKIPFSEERRRLARFVSTRPPTVVVIAIYDFLGAVTLALIARPFLGLPLVGRFRVKNWKVVVGVGKIGSSSSGSQKEVAHRPPHCGRSALLYSGRRLRDVPYRRIFPLRAR